MHRDIVLVGGCIGLVGIILLLWPFFVWLARVPLRHAVVRLSPWLSVLERRRRRSGVVLVVVGLLVAALGYGLARRQADVREDRKRAELQRTADELAARLEIGAKIDADAATRPRVTHTDLRPDGSHRAIALHFPTTLGDTKYWRAPMASRCKALLDVPVTQAIVRDMKSCLHPKVVAIVREHPKATGQRFAGDALVYEIAAGRYLGGVVIEILDEAGSMPLGHYAENQLLVAMTGRVDPLPDVEK